MREGYYAHLWLRDARGRWLLAYDIAHRSRLALESETRSPMTSE